MPRSGLSWPVVIVGIAHLVYAAIVTTLWLAGRPTPPAAVGSIIAASIVSAFILAMGRNSRAEIQTLAQLCAELAERVHKIEERQPSPQGVHASPATTSDREPIVDYLEDAAHLYDLGRLAEQERRRREGDDDTSV